MFATPKRHILGQNRMFWRISRQNPSTALGCSELQEPKKTNTFWCAKSRMRGNETPGRIVKNCCTGVGVHDVITCADLYYDRLRRLGVAGGQILGFSIDLLRRPYNTLALPCECVMGWVRIVWESHQLIRGRCTLLVVWYSGRTLVFDRRTFPVLRSTYSWRVTT